MEKFKGTKGTWEVKFDNNQIILTDAGAYLPNAMHKTISTDLELKANALLISKAPEMLEMLQRILEWDIEDAPHITTEIKQLIKEATEI
jgi:hypothetical protein